MTGGILLAMENEPIEAATVVLLRDVGAGVECLMLHKTAGQAFGEHWVFPGGRLEPSDGDGPEGRCRAAVREAFEETGLVLDAADLVAFSHWMPPEETAKRFSTWFFLARLPAGASDVVVDGGEIGDQMWTTAAAALERHRRGEAQLAPPTWVTLHWLSEATSVDDAFVRAGGGFRHYTSRFVTDDGVLVGLWAPDAAYDTGDLTLTGPRHRLRMEPDGWQFERR